MDVNNDKDPMNFLTNLKEDIAACFRNGNTIEAFLKSEFGITNVMQYEFTELKDKDESDFVFCKMRGNTGIREGQIRTYKQSQAFMDKTSHNDFSKLKL